MDDALEESEFRPLVLERPKTFQALRVTRETELAAVLPLHVVTAWCGNTLKVALGHYLKTISEYHEQALALDVVEESAEAKRHEIRHGLRRNGREHGGV